MSDPKTFDLSSLLEAGAAVALDRLLQAAERPESAMTESQIAACVAVIGLKGGPAVFEVRPGDTLMIPIAEGMSEADAEALKRHFDGLLPSGARVALVLPRVKVPFCVVRPQAVPASGTVGVTYGSGGGGGVGVGGVGVAMSGGVASGGGGAPAETTTRTEANALFLHRDTTGLGGLRWQDGPDRCLLLDSSGEHRASVAAFGDGLWIGRVLDGGLLTREYLSRSPPLPLALAKRWTEEAVRRLALGVHPAQIARDLAQGMDPG